MKSILYIEDNEDDCMTAIRSFSNSDMHIACVNDIASAFSALARKAYDIVISDIMLPKGDGLFFAKRLNDAGINVKLILTSGIPSLKSFENYSALDNYLGFILKPVTPQKINALMELAA